MRKTPVHHRAGMMPLDHVKNPAMRTRSALILLLAAALAHGADLQQLADSLTLPQLTPATRKLQVPVIPGAKVEFLGADYEQVITADGSIQPVLSNTTVDVSFRLTQGGKTVMSKDYPLTVPAATKATGGNAKPAVIPDLREWRGGSGDFKLTPASRIIVVTPADKELVTKVRVFAADLAEVTGAKTPYAIVTDPAVKPAAGDIAIGISRNDPALGKEGYRMIVGEHLAIAAPHPQGAFWGTRSVLQILRQTGGTIPQGTARDYPRFPVRGFMLDVGRTPVPLPYLHQVVKTMAWYKMNDFQVHLNDNYIFHEHYVKKGQDPFKMSYAGFRLESKVVGKDGTPLTSKDLFYTKKEFRDLIDRATAHGVAIVPEFDTPGHALSFTRVRPDLIYKGPMGHHPDRRCEMLDAANPETLKFVGGVFDEYLLPPAQGQKPLFDGCTVHVGADEFFGDKEVYRNYANGILEHVIKRGYTPRIWGSLHAKPGKTPVVAKGVQMNLWSYDWARAFESIEQGYDIINTADNALYIVPFAGYYRMDNNHKGLFDNWQVNKIHKDTVPSGHPQLLGAMFAVWNDETDLLHSGYSPDDVWPAISRSIDILGQKMWGRENVRDYARHQQLAAKLGDAPGTNPSRTIPSKGETVIDLDFDSGRDASGNGYNAKPGQGAALAEGRTGKGLALAGGSSSAEIGLPALGPGYRLSFDIRRAADSGDTEQILFEGPEGAFIAVQDGSGKMALRRGDRMVFTFGYALPKDQWTHVELVARPMAVELHIDGALKETIAWKDGSTQKKRASFPLPLARIGSTTKAFKGTLDNLKIEKPATLLAPLSLKTGWSPDTLPPAGGKVRITDLPDFTKPGTYSFTFTYQRGTHGIRIRSLALRDGKTVVAEDRHDGFAGGRPDKNTYQLTIDKPLASPVLEIDLDLNNGETDSHGRIEVREP